MNGLSLFNNFGYILPEAIITIALALIVTYNLIFPKARKALAVISVISIIAALWFSIQQYWIAPTPLTAEAGFLKMLVVDKLGVFFKVIVLLTSLFIVLFTEFSDELTGSFDRAGEYYSLMFGMILGMLLMISSSNFIMLYVSMELLSLSSYVLAGFMKQTERSSEAALKYIIYGAVSSGIMLFGISLLYGLTGTFGYTDTNHILRLVGQNQSILILIGILLFAGIGYKISSVPFHFWTPDVYEGAPTTITAYLSVASKAAGFAALIRILQIGFSVTTNADGFWTMLPYFPWKDFLIYLSILTMTVGNLAALWQDNVKRMLAYSSIAHAGYLLAALSVLSGSGLMAVLIYFAIYMVMNLGAFLVVILIQNKIGSENVDDYNGLGAKVPFYGVCLGIFLVSLTGLPPTAGFIGKLYVFMALLEAKHYNLAIIAVINSVISLYYYIRVLKHMYLMKGNENLADGAEAGVSNKVLVLVLAIPSLLFGIYFTPLIEWAKAALQ